MPRTSGLAIALPVIRCINNPATASMAPAAAAAMTRGRRQAVRASNWSPKEKAQPSGPGPKVRASPIRIKTPAASVKVR